MSPLGGPSGLGTSAARLLAPRPPATGPDDETVAALRLDCPAPRRVDPPTAARITERLVEWADRIGLYHGRLERVRAADFGSLATLCYPGTDDPERLMVPARCALAIWAADDHYCDDPTLGADPGIAPSRLATAAAVLGKIRLPACYEAEFDDATRADPALTALRDAVTDLARLATPVQLDRTRMSLYNLLTALAQESSWRATHYRPRVWEYLVNRQANSFLPCMTAIDAIGGYHLPSRLWSDPQVYDTVGLAGLASCVANDIYSADVESHSAGEDFNLPRAIAEERHCSHREALLLSAGLHNDLMRRVREQSCALAHRDSPELRRFLDGVLDWCAGSLAWHRSSPRYRPATLTDPTAHDKDGP